MFLLQKYVFKKFIISLSCIVFVLLCLFVLVRFTERVNHFVAIASTTPFLTFVFYFTTEMPYTLNYLFPIACMFSLVYVLGKLNNENELTIFYSSGRRLWLFLMPIYIFIFIICTVFFIFDKELLYNPHKKHKAIQAELYGDAKKESFPHLNFVQFGSENKIYMVEKFSPKTGDLNNLRILFLNKDNNFERFVVVKEAKNIEQSRWDLLHFYSRKLIGGSDIVYSYEETKELDLGEEPFHFEKANFNPEDLSSQELYKEAQKIQTIGGNHKKVWTDFYFKTATPYIALVMLFLAFPLATYSKNAVLVLSFFWVLMVAFAYMVIMNIGVSLGHNGLLPPLIAGWFGNIIFFLLSIVLYFRLRK